MKYVSLDKKGCYWVRIVPNAKLLPYLRIKDQYIRSLGVVSQSQAEKKAVSFIHCWLKEIEVAKKQLALTRSGDTSTKAVQQLITSNVPITDELSEMLGGWCNEAFYDGREGSGIEERKNTLRRDGKGVLSAFYLGEYEASLKHLRSRTVQQRISRIRDQFVPCFPYLDADTISSEKLQQWIDGFTLVASPPTKATLTGYVGDARRYVEWLAKKGYLNYGNSFFPTKLPNKKELKDKLARKEFTDEDLALLLHSVKDKDLKYYIVLAMYTGCRIEEIAQLKVKDVLKEGERYFIQIKVSKTEAGKREVPIHNAIEGVIKDRLSNEGYLFSIGSDNKAGKRSDKYSKNFGRLKSKLGFGPELVFHSIRKSFITKLDQAEVSEGVAADIVGHDKQTITYGLYSAGSKKKQKIEAIDGVSYRLSLTL